MAKKYSKNHGRSKKKAYASFTSDKGATAQRTHKDTLFRFIFRDRKKLLQLYNALSGSDYEDINFLTVTTLENVVYLGYKNDASFLVDMTLYLVEHQGSWNPNMPLRGVFYFARLYRNFVEENGYDIYGSKVLTLPYPQFIVFYNGTDKRPERQILKLSDSFHKRRTGEFFTTPALECQALMLNINYGSNQKLLENCRPLMEYSQFIYQIRQYMKAGVSPERAVDLAVDDCIQKGILSDVLRTHRKEVISMFLEDYDEELHLRTLRREGYEEGMQEGLQAGLLAYIALCREMKFSEEDILTRITEQFKLSEDEARRAVRQIDVRHS